MPYSYTVMQYGYCTPILFDQQQQLGEGGKIGPCVKYWPIKQYFD